MQDLLIGCFIIFGITWINILTYHLYREYKRQQYYENLKTQALNVTEKALDLFYKFSMINYTSGTDTIKKMLIEISKDMITNQIKSPNLFEDFPMLTSLTPKKYCPSKSPKIKCKHKTHSYECDEYNSECESGAESKPCPCPSENYGKEKLGPSPFENYEIKI
jgi:hypothetical protein